METSEMTQEQRMDEYQEFKKNMHSFQNEQRTFNSEMAGFRAETEGSLAALHEKAAELATKKDIKEIKEFMKNINVGLGFFRFSWNNASKIGSFLLLIAAIGAFIKFGFLGALAWLVPDKP